MELLRQIEKVTVAGGHRLAVTFDTGDTGVFDMSALLGYSCYRRLKDDAYFRLAHVERGTVVWPNDEDVAPELLWEQCSKNECKMV